MFKRSTRAWKAAAITAAVAGLTLTAVPQARAAVPRTPAQVPKAADSIFVAPLPTTPYQVEFQSNNSEIGESGLPYGSRSDLGVLMAPGTSPSVASVPVTDSLFPSDGYVAVFQGSDGILWDNTGAGSGSLGVTMAGGTSPAVAVTSGGNVQFVWQGANNHLWTWIYGSNGPIDTGLSMMPGTSPTLVELPGTSGNGNHGYWILFQGSDGYLWYDTSAGGGSMLAPMAPGTSPSVEPTPNDPSGFQAVWQGANNHLWTTAPGGDVDTGLSMMPGTSPAVVELPGTSGNGNHGYWILFHGSDGYLWYDTSAGGGSMLAPMAPGTSPSVALTAADPSGFQAVWQGANNDLWTTWPGGDVDTGLSMLAGTSPSITAITGL